ncbi:hypothetical protein Tco_1043934 [Tanacetum coccineum]|uniref:Uncharacterized protein n=1 Tax=Tanacetum coccineum TaxID=301880 RepID=A0ABQ5GPQ9_9ASTR
MGERSGTEIIVISNQIFTNLRTAWKGGFHLNIELCQMLKKYGRTIYIKPVERIWGGKPIVGSNSPICSINVNVFHSFIKTRMLQRRSLATNHMDMTEVNDGPSSNVDCLCFGVVDSFRWCSMGSLHIGRPNKWNRWRSDFRKRVNSSGKEGSEGLKVWNESLENRDIWMSKVVDSDSSKNFNKDSECRLLETGFARGGFIIGGVEMDLDDSF